MSLRNPVKYPVKYYSWQDANAPQLTDADGVIKTILKACLVTGYGSKAGAGWTALFEDAYRIVLRRPLRTGNPADVKIENGTITGTTKRHRIVAQDNPAGLDDANELSAVNLLAHDNAAGKEWYCIVTDFAFVLCYQMGAAGRYAYEPRNHIIYVGSAKKIKDLDEEGFLLTSAYANNNGTGDYSVSGLLGSNDYTKIINARDAKVLDKYYLSVNTAEKINDDYFCQQIMLSDRFLLPILCAVSSQFDDMQSKIVKIDNRDMLRYVNRHINNNGAKALYIPIDYWEL